MDTNGHKKQRRGSLKKYLNLVTTGSFLKQPKNDNNETERGILKSPKKLKRKSNTARRTGFMKSARR